MRRGQDDLRVLRLLLLRGQWLSMGTYRKGLVAHGSLLALLGQVQCIHSEQFEDGICSVCRHVGLSWRRDWNEKAILVRF